MANFPKFPVSLARAETVRDHVRYFYAFLRTCLAWLVLGLQLNLLVGTALASSLNNTPLVYYDATERMFRLDATELEPWPGASGEIDYLWIVTGSPTGSSAIFSNTETVITSLGADLDGDYTIELQTTVDGLPQAPIIFSASTVNNTPISNVTVVGGASPISVGAPIRLSAASSFDPDGNRVSYQWLVASAPVASAAALSAADTALVDFVPDVVGEYTFSLTVIDEAGLSAVDTIQLSTDAGVLTADAGKDQSVELGDTVLLDAFGSTLTTAMEVTTAWSVISAPAGSAATIVYGRDLSPEQPGRVSFTPDAVGIYLINLAATGDNQTSFDRVILSVGAAANAAPVANAGSNTIVIAGETVTLSAIKSSDVDGDLLSYDWSLISSPVGSFAALVDGSLPQASLLTDLPGSYVAQVAVTDGSSISFDTVTVSTGPVAPSAGAGADTLLPTNLIATLDGSQSATSPSTSYMWSLLGLTGNSAATAGQVTDLLAQSTDVDLSDSGVGGMTSPAISLEDYDLIVFENSNSRSQVYGRTFIGGNLNGQSSDYANQLPNANGVDVLTVGGNINGNPKNINNGGSVRVGGNANASINLNGGGQLISDPSISIGPIETSIRSFSTSLKNLASTGTVSIPAGQPGPVNIVAVPGTDGIAVIDIPVGNKLFNNNKVQQIDIDLNGASALVVNVGGSNVKFKKGNFVGNANSHDVRSKTIWNFHSAANIRTERHLSGSLIAPNAQLQNRSPIYGSVAVRRINHRAAIALPGFGAADAFGTAPMPLDSVVAQIKVSDGGFETFDTVLVTNGNISPVAGITTSAEAVDVGQSVILFGNTSGDVNGDALTYSWSLIAKPQGSNTVVAGGGGQ